MRGKYSPTVSAAYMANQQWFINYCVHDINSSEYSQYDPEGFDAYGYDANDIDRAGNYESDYYQDDNYDVDPDYNSAYENALDEWTFDGIKPVSKFK